MTGSEEEIWFPVVSRIYFSDFKCQNILLTETHKYAFRAVLPDGMYLLSCADRCHELCCMRCAVAYWCQTDPGIKKPGLSCGEDSPGFMYVCASGITAAHNVCS